MALVMVMTMAQCKKDSPTTPDNQNNVVTITLDVKNNKGSKVDVNTTTGTVNFETGDKVYVGSGGKYVGFLTHNGTNFVGNITNPTENQPLQFYFLGNVTPIETLSAGTTEECSVIISDQTEHLPVISCAASFENYVSGVTSYTGHLLNKCTLVKFNVTTPSNSPICIIGMNNKVTVDFTQNTVTHSIDGDGVIMLPAGSGENVEKWAILLPQEALEEGEEGSVYSEDGLYIGLRPAIPIINENNYLADGINIVLENSNTPVVPEGAINGLFTINENGDQIYFSQGNLQYQASTNTWRFAENQYDCIGGANSSISSTYSGWIDLFGWGTSGFNHGANCYQPWSISTNNGNYYAYGVYTNNLYDQTGQADWGYNPVSNGGNTINLWRTLTQLEWDYIFNTRTTASGIRYAKANVNGMNGVILLSDNWNSNIYCLNNANTDNASFNSNTLTTEQWGILEQAGAVFLATAGYRDGISVNHTGTGGTYWTASYYNYNNYDAFGVYFYDGGLESYDYYYRFYGFSVRLVQDY
jgi:hypothetical protein